jgi:hypothetical protein
MKIEYNEKKKKEKRNNILMQAKKRIKNLLERIEKTIAKVESCTLLPIIVRLARTYVVFTV